MPKHYISIFFSILNFVCVFRSIIYFKDLDHPTISASGALKLELNLVEDPSKGSFAALAGASVASRRASFSSSSTSNLLSHGNNSNNGSYTKSSAQQQQWLLNEPLKEPLTQVVFPTLLDADSPWEIGPRATLVVVGCAAKSQRVWLADQKVYG